MKYIYKFPEWIIKISFNLAVWLIEKFHNMAAYEEQIAQLRKLPKGTLGKEIADCLDMHKLRLVPGYESHDLKHVLLDFKMTPLDEIRLQAFMIGNGNVTLASLAIFTFGFILLPHKWIQFSKDFQLGLNSKPIKAWSIEEYANEDLANLRDSLPVTTGNESKSGNFIPKLVYASSILAMITGVVGMLYCLPYLFSPIMEDLVGAGFPFLAGTLLFIGGLISISIQNKKEKMSYYQPYTS